MNINCAERQRVSAMLGTPCPLTTPHVAGLERGM